MKTNIRNLSALALSVGILSLLPFSPAAATQSAASASEPGQSCWYDIDTDTMGCFDAALDPVEQIALATGAEVVAVPTGATPVAAFRAATTAASTTAGDEVFLLATGYDNVNYGAPSVTYVTSNPSICNGIWHTFPSLGVWNDRFESLESYNGCVTYLYDSTNFGGTEYGPITASPDLGSFNNRARAMVVE